MKNFPSQSVVFVQGKLCSISKLLCHAVYDWLSFISNQKLTALHCLVCYFIQVLLSRVSSARKGNIYLDSPCV